ncbi:MAG: hypothetical protein JW969_08775 [Spirochaetales bacterium]|nr:hypothetical protein [Spirochaetales bacterium]
MIKKCVILFLLIFYGMALFSQEAKPTLAILNVKGEGVEKSKTELIFEYIVDMVNRTGGFTLVERKELDKALEELELSLSSIVDEKTAVQVGRISGAAYILLPSLILEEKTYYLSMRIISVQTANVVRTSIKDTDSFKNIESLTKEAVEYLLDFDFNSLYGEGHAIIRNFISTGAGFGVNFPLGDIAQVWGIGTSPLVYGAYNMTFEWGILGFGAVTGAVILFENPLIAYQFDTLAIPLAAIVRYETNFDTPLFGFGELCAGITVLTVNYKGSYGITQTPALKPLVSAGIGAGYRITPNFNISLSGTCNLIIMDSATYIDITPAIRAGFYF